MAGIAEKSTFAALLKPGARCNRLILGKIAGCGYQAPILVRHAEPEKFGELRLERSEMAGITRRAGSLLIIGHDLGGGRLKNRLPGCQARVDRMTDLRGELGQQAFGIGARAISGFLGGQIRPHQRRHHNNGEDRPADGGGEAPSRMQMLKEAHDLRRGSSAARFKRMTLVMA
ncbi:MAG TPA: hypothetical protein PLP22_10870 [Candidatus Competibacter sp.]|nr:hypothetical protein [Candidatus Competibacter sp.]